MQQGVRIAAPGTAMDLAVGLVAARALTSILYGTSVANPATFVIAAVVPIATAMAACYLPARQAASIDPRELLWNSRQGRLARMNPMRQLSD
jgi:ABC-type antimicrobial peptide transport system permease subunit